MAAYVYGTSLKVKLFLDQHNMKYKLYSTTESLSFLSFILYPFFFIFLYQNLLFVEMVLYLISCKCWATHLFNKTGQGNPSLILKANFHLLKQQFLTNVKK